MTKKTTITWTSVTIKLHAPEKYTFSGQTQDTLTDAQINAVNMFVRDWVRRHPELFRIDIDNGSGIADSK